MSLKNPCYDVKTKTNCPRRCAECGVTCPEWLAYVEERNNLYERKEQERKRIAGEIAQKQRLKKIHDKKSYISSGKQK